MPSLFTIEVNSKLGNGLHANGSKLHCKRVLLFHMPKTVLPMNGVYWIELGNKTSFEPSTPLGVYEYLHHLVSFVFSKS